MTSKEDQAVLLIPVISSSKEDQTAGLLRLDTTIGPVVVLFSTQERLQDFARLMEPAMTAAGEVFGWIEAPSGTFDEVVSMLQADRTLSSGDEQYIPDDDALYLDLHKALQGGGA
jgi:hypothetical protein